ENRNVELFGRPPPRFRLGSASDHQDVRAVDADNAPAAWAGVFADGPAGGMAEGRAADSHGLSLPRTRGSMEWLRWPRPRRAPCFPWPDSRPAPASTSRG